MRAKLVKANYEIKLGNMETALVDIEKALEESKYNSEAMTTALAIYGNNKDMTKSIRMFYHILIL